MEDQFSRTRLLLGESGVERLRRARVAVFGIGGVGGFVVEALARSGVGELHLVDHDRVSLSNLNRQIIATHETLGQYKVDAARSRVLSIDPQTLVYTYKTFITPETAGELDFTRFDYVVDAIDTVTGKLTLVKCAYDAGVPVISSMGAGNKLDPTAFQVADIYSTSMDPLARVMRKELKKRGIPALKVVYSREEPQRLEAQDAPKLPGSPFRRAVPGSVAFVPSAAGLIIAGEVVKDLTGVSSGSR